MEFAEFKMQVYKNFGLDLNSYKENQLKRRLDNLLFRYQMKDYRDLLDKMLRDRQEYIKFLDYLTINVSEFFRDAKMFRFLEQEVLPGLIAGGRRLRIWSAACSNGAEPYSVAIILDELTPQTVHRIDATDLDQTILKKAKAAFVETTIF